MEQNKTVLMQMYSRWEGDSERAAVAATAAAAAGNAPGMKTSREIELVFTMSILLRKGITYSVETLTGNICCYLDIQLFCKQIKNTNFCFLLVALQR